MAFNPKSGYCFIILALLSVNINAAVVTYDLTASVTSGPFAGEVGTGTLSYDVDPTLSGFICANPIFAGCLPGSLSLNLTIFGQTFTETDDSLYNDGAPVLFVVAGLPLELSAFGVTEDNNGDPSINTTEIIQPGITSFAVGVSEFLNDSFQANGTVLVNVGVVPIPGAVWLFGSGLIGLIGIARRKKT